MQPTLNNLVACYRRGSGARHFRYYNTPERGQRQRRCLSVARAFCSGRGPQNREGDVRGLFDHLEQGAGWAPGRALALLPVAHRLDRNSDPGGELRLRELGARPHAARIGGIRRCAVGRRASRAAAGRCPWLADVVELPGTSALAAVGQNLDDRPSAFNLTRIIVAIGLCDSLLPAKQLHRDGADEAPRQRPNNPLNDSSLHYSLARSRESDTDLAPSNNRSISSRGVGLANR